MAHHGGGADGAERVGERGGLGGVVEATQVSVNVPKNTVRMLSVLEPQYFTLVPRVCVWDEAEEVVEGVLAQQVPRREESRCELCV